MNKSDLAYLNELQKEIYAVMNKYMNDLLKKSTLLNNYQTKNLDGDTTSQINGANDIARNR